MVFGPVITVFASLQKSAELDGLVCFIMVHGTQIKLDQTKQKTSKNNEQE
jgi:hypothetical protein